MLLVCSERVTYPEQPKERRASDNNFYENCLMLHAPKQTRTVNKFQFVAIPSPRDLYSRYGSRVGDESNYSTDASTQVNPSLTSGGSVIDQLITAQNYLNKATVQK